MAREYCNRAQALAQALFVGTFRNAYFVTFLAKAIAIWLAQAYSGDRLNETGAAGMTLTEQLNKTLKFAGKSAALDRARAGLASLCLGRKFGETLGQYLARDKSAAARYGEYTNYIASLS